MSTLWTGWMDYFATGEGRSLMAYIGHARRANELRTNASQALGEYYAKGLNVAEGVIENDVTLVVFSAKTFSWFARLTARQPSAATGWCPSIAPNAMKGLSSNSPVTISGNAS